MSSLKVLACRWSLTFTVAVAAGCTSVNKPLNDARVPLESRTRNATRAGSFLEAAPMNAGKTADALRPTTSPTDARVTDRDGYFVGIAISGGGSRSANFSAACMFQLQRLGVLQHCDYISSVSGGSLTAAYYCAWGNEWNPGNVQKEMTHSFASDMVVQTLMPWNAFGMTFSHLDRSDLLANTLRANLFTRNGKQLTFGDLRPDRPRLMINATDLQSGRPFVFSNETFDALNSDLSRYPLAYAVAASSSVPVLLHHVTLRDHSTTFKQYRHLVDGGVTDNLGIQTLVNVFESQTTSAMDKGQPVPYPKGAIFIVLDATTQFDAKLSDRGDITLLDSLKFGAGLSSTVLINRASTATLAEMIVKHGDAKLSAENLRENIATLNGTGHLTMRDSRGQEIQVMHIALTQLNDVSNLPFQSFGESVNGIATYFNIDATAAYHLYQAAELIIQDKFEQPLIKVAEQLKQANAQRP